MTRTEDFKRVRRTGKSHAHPLLVLISAPNQLEFTRFGLIAGKPVGGAVQRNRVKRWMRSAIQPLIPALVPGNDVVLIARQKIAEATFQQTQSALNGLLVRARILQEEKVG